MASSIGVLSSDVAPIFVSLAVLAAYSIAPALSYGRLSPPTFFTAALGMAAAALRPTLPVALAASVSGIAAALLLVLDQIVSSCHGWDEEVSRKLQAEIIPQHGDCYYSVLAGKSWPRPGIQSDLGEWASLGFLSSSRCSRAQSKRLSFLHAAYYQRCTQSAHAFYIMVVLR